MRDEACNAADHGDVATVKINELMNLQDCVEKNCGDKNETEEWKEEVEVAYRVNESPPLTLCLLLGFQHYLSMFVATLSIPILLSPAICMHDDNVGKSEVIETLFVASGFITLLQTFLGVRLPIVQAGTFALLVPTLSYLNLPKWKCPDNIYSSDMLKNISFHENHTEYIETGSEEHKEIWKIRLREIQGAIMCASLFEIFVGASGIVGLMMKFIGPLTICPIVTLLGLSLFKSAAGLAAKHWGICFLTIILMIIFSQYLSRVNIPCVVYARSSGCQKQMFPVFKMFPVILSVVVSWIFCAIMTATNVFQSEKSDSGHYARTDLRMDAIYSSPWFRIPYPGQWGMPTVSISAVCAVLSGILATTIESVGDYHACARLAGAPPPPLHAINRGILVEGIGTFLDGLIGTGNGTTSTSINVGVVGITKVGSRRVVQVSAAFMIVFGIFTKFGALFITIPDPIIGATFFILFGMIVAVGLSSLQNVDMNSGRNLFIVGFALFTGLSLPQWMMSNAEAIKTGSETVDSVSTVLLSTGMFVGGFIGFVLDNTIPGTQLERGILHWKKLRSSVEKMTACQYLRQQMADTYDLPYTTTVLQKVKLFRYIPFCPMFVGFKLRGIKKLLHSETNNSDKSNSHVLIS